MNRRRSPFPGFDTRRAAQHEIEQAQAALRDPTNKYHAVAKIQLENARKKMAESFDLPKDKA